MIGVVLLIVALVAVGVWLLAYRNRPEHSIESGITSFKREMRALAPPRQRRRAPSELEVTPPDEGPGEWDSHEPPADEPHPGAG